MLKKKILLIFTATLLFASVPLSNVSAEESIITGWIRVCRCHSDGTCQPGSPISFRSACAKAKVETFDIFIADCNIAEVNCPH